MPTNYYFFFYIYIHVIMLRERVFFSLCVATYAPAFTRVPYVYVVYVFFFFISYICTHVVRVCIRARARTNTRRVHAQRYVWVLLRLPRTPVREYTCVSCVCMYACLASLPVCLCPSVCPVSGRLSLCIYTYIYTHIALNMYTLRVDYDTSV